MRGAHVLLLVLLGVVLALFVVEWAGRAEEAPPPEPEVQTLDRFERFTIYNQTADPIEFKELEFTLMSGGTFSGNGMRIPHGSWNVKPGTADQVSRVVFRYGVEGAEKWFEIKADPGTKLLTAKAVIAGPDAGEVQVSGTDIKIDEASVKENEGEKPPK